MPYEDPEFIKMTEEEFLERRKKKLPEGADRPRGTQRSPFPSGMRGCSHAQNRC